MVGMIPELQAMTGLTSGRTSAVAAEALGRRLAVPVTGRWLAMVAAR